jgi:hypothetical protein
MKGLAPHPCAVGQPTGGSQHRLYPRPPSSSGRPEILPGSIPTSDTDSDDDYTAATTSELDDST